MTPRAGAGGATRGESPVSGPLQRAMAPALHPGVAPRCTRHCAPLPGAPLHPVALARDAPTRKIIKCGGRAPHAQPDARAAAIDSTAGRRRGRDGPAKTDREDDGDAP